MSELPEKQYPEVLNRMIVPTRLPPKDNEGAGFQPPSKIDPRSDAHTARIIAFSLIILLVVSVVAQYVALIVLTVYNRNEAIPNFEHLFNACFPVLAGLVGSAVTYYLTKERK